MRAVVADGYGAPDRLRLAEVPDPAPGPGQVRVRMRASSINPLDRKLLAGGLRHALPLAFPAVLGFDVAGEVESLGPGAGGFAVGERVYGRLDRATGGAHAELAVAGAAVLDRIPARLTFEQAAALPLVGMTAIQALEDIAGLRAGRSLLVVGVGGVGAHAIQIGRALGATVTAVAGATAAPLAMRLGAGAVVDPAPGGLERLDRSFDVIFDTAAARPFRDFAPRLSRGGTYVTTGFSPGLVAHAVLGRLAGRRVAWVLSGPDGGRMRRLSARVADHGLEPVVQATFPLERVRDAYQCLEAGHLRGKIVLTIP